MAWYLSKIQEQAILGLVTGVIGSLSVMIGLKLAEPLTEKMIFFKLLQ